MGKIGIECQNIKKVYGTKDTRIEALKGINLTIEEGKLTLLVGPSGSGKSTLLSIITTILTPDEGKLFLLGQDISLLNDDERAKFCLHNLGIVFQSLFLIPTLTTLENITLPLVIAGADEKMAQERAYELLTKMHLQDRAHTSPYNLSKGQQQRIAIARAIVNDSKIIVCDEPTSALDHVVGQEIMTILHDLATKQSRLVLVVTHDHRIFSFADHMIHMEDGQITSGN